MVGFLDFGHVSLGGYGWRDVMVVGHACLFSIVLANECP